MLTLARARRLDAVRSLLYRINPWDSVHTCCRHKLSGALTQALTNHAVGRCVERFISSTSSPPEKDLVTALTTLSEECSDDRAIILKKREARESETDVLIERIQQQDPYLDVEQCFFAMEAWMEDASDNTSPNDNNLFLAQRAQQILDALEQNQRLQKETVLVPPKASFYDVVLHTYAVCGGEAVAAQTAQVLLQRMLEQCRSFRDNNSSNANARPPPEPTTKTFNIVINAWSKSNVEDAGPRAEAILGLMANWNAECHNHPSPPYAYKGSVPNNRTWSSIINAWARRSTAQSRIRVVEILHKVKAEHERAKQQLQQTQEVAISTSSNKNNPNGPVVEPEVLNTALKVFVDEKLGRRDGAMKAEFLFKWYQQWHETDWTVAAPNTRSHTLLLDAWASCCTVEGAERTEAILGTMVRLYRQGKGVLPNCVSFTTCMSAWARLQRLKNDYNYAPERAESILVKLVAFYEETKEEALRPQTESCNIVISCWVRALDRGDSIHRARQVFDKAKRYAKPDLVTYNTLLDGLSKRGQGSDALEILEWLESDSTYLMPDRISYNTVLAAVARDRSLEPEVALSVLERMQEPDNGRTGITPDKKSYTAVLTTIRRSPQLAIADAERAAALVAEMEDSASCHKVTQDDLKPDVFLLAILISLCAKVQGTVDERGRALQIALGAMNKVTSGAYGLPTAISFEAMLRTIGILCEPGKRKDDMLLLYFDQCAERGFVSEGVVKAMVKGGAWMDKTALPPDFKELWSRNTTFNQRPSRG